MQKSRLLLVLQFILILFAISLPLGNTFGYPINLTFKASSDLLNTADGNLTVTFSDGVGFVPGGGNMVWEVHRGTTQVWGPGDHAAGTYWGYEFRNDDLSAGPISGPPNSVSWTAIGNGPGWSVNCSGSISNASNLPGNGYIVPSAQITIELTAEPNGYGGDGPKCVDQKVRAGGCSTCGGAGPVGMAQYNATAFNASLNMFDTPVRYVSPMGPTIDFTATYNQKESQQPVSPTYANLGPKWTFNWLSYVTVEDTSDVGAPTTAARVYLAGGGTEVYSSFTTSSAQNRQSHAILWRTGADLYERRLPDGSKQVFGPKTTSANFSRRRLFMVQTIDPAGNIVSINYEQTGLRILSVNDALNQGITLSYELQSDPLKVTKIQDSFGKVATLTYYGDGKLQTITDPVLIQSTFQYETGGDFINKLTTPYGDSLFTHGLPGQSWLTMTDPEGGQEKVEFKNHTTAIAATETIVPNISGITNAKLDATNTFYWDKKAMSVGPNDYTKARVTHWLYDGGTISSIAASEKAALERRVWHTYENQADANFVGSTDNASQSARVLADGTTQVWSYTYNSIGKIRTVADPRVDPQNGNRVPRITSYVYDANGLDLLEVWQQNAAATTVDPYDATKHADKIATYANYVAHKAQSITDAAGQITTYSYNSYGQLRSITNARGETTTYTYDRDQNGDGITDGYLSLVTAPPVTGVSPTMAFAYDGGADRVHTITSNPDNYTITTTRDDLGRATTIAYGDTPQTTQEYDYHKYVNGVLQSGVMTLDVGMSKDRRGRTTYREYNNVRRLTKVKEHVSDSPALDRLTEYVWCNCGALASIIDPNIHTTNFTYDDQGRLITKTFHDSKTINYLYDGQSAANTAGASSRLKSVTDGRNITATYTYFTDDDLKQLSYSDGGVTPTAMFAYDASYNRVASMTDGTGLTSYSYYPVQASPPTGAYANALKDVDGPLVNDTITHTYDQLGRTIGQSINGVASTVQFNSAGQVATSDNPLGHFARTYVPGTSRLQALTYPAGSTAYSYFDNTNDRRLQTLQNFGPSSSNLSKFDYTYDAEAQILTWNKLLGTATRNDTFGYDLVDRLTNSTEFRSPDVYAIQDFTYDVAGNRTDGGAFTFNSVNQISNAGYAYDNNGNLTADPSRSYEWDAANRLTAINYINIPGIRTEFTYDGLGRRVKITEKTLPSPDINVNVTPAGRQYAVTTFATVSLSSGTYTLTITGLNPNGGTNMALIDLIKLNGSVIANGGFEIPVLAGGTYQFNPTGASPWLFTGTTGITRNNSIYTGTVAAPEGHQAGMVQDTGKVSQTMTLTAGSYVLKMSTSQAKGNATTQTIQTTLQNSGYTVITSTKQFIWRGNSIAEERDVSNNVTRRFYTEGEQIGGVSYYYTRDHLGSVRELVDATGAIQARYDYDAYGYRTKLSGNLDAQFGYTGHYFHQPSGLSLALYRAYDPDRGRWISRDPIAEADGVNLYGYVQNDPLNRVDSLGLTTEYWTGEKAPDQFEHFTTASVLWHKWDEGNSPATLIWTKPCGKDVPVKVEVTRRPTPGSTAHISGADAIMWVESRYALLPWHSGKDAINATRAKFLCRVVCP